MKKKVLVYMITLTVIFSCFSEMETIVNASEEQSLSDIMETEDYPTEDFSSEDREWELYDTEDIFVADADADESAYDAHDPEEPEVFSEDDVNCQEILDINGIIEDISESVETESDETGLIEEILVAASDITPIDTEFYPYPISSGNKSYYSLTPGKSGIYCFVGNGAYVSSIMNSEGNERISAEYKEDDNTYIKTAQLIEGMQYEIEFTLSQQSSGGNASSGASFYYYCVPRFCVKVKKDSASSGTDVDDFWKEFRFVNRTGDISVFTTKLLDDLNHFEDYYFLTIIPNDPATPAQPVNNGDGTYFVNLQDPLTRQKLSHSWSAVDSNGNRSCFICGATERVASQLKSASPSVPVYRIAGKPAKVKVSKAGKRKLKVSWIKPAKSKLKKIKGLYIEVATDKAFTNVVRRKKVKKTKTSYIFKKLNKNQRYYVRVRFYNKGKDISMWSPIKNIKVK